MRNVQIGYVPLTDAAVLITAAERGFAEKQGLSITLVREVSWANIRDRLILGQFDAAHMLAPFAIATSLGFGHIRVPLVAPFAINLNGNAITLSDKLFAHMAQLYGRAPENPVQAAQALAAAVAARRARRPEPYSFGMVFPFSTHTYLLRHWLRLGGIDPERDVHLVVVPPPYMADSMRTGLIDGFCVGSPWSSLAVEAGGGRIVAAGVEIARRAPEKILAMPQTLADREPELVLALIRALDGAAAWCAAPENREDLSRLVAAPAYLDLPVNIVRDTLDGRFRLAPGTSSTSYADFLMLDGREVNRPDPRRAMWLYAEMVLARQTDYAAGAARAAAAVFRPDLYDAAMGPAAEKDAADPIGLVHGPRFVADKLDEYIAAMRA